MKQEDTERLYSKLKSEAENSGYWMNPDEDFAKALVNGLITNEERYGYRACPCRLASGVKEEDLDIICPCDYRDADVAEFGSCYCALYVSQAVHKGEKKAEPIPERRKPFENGQIKSTQNTAVSGKLSYPIWRCKVCGYLCAREEPPEICPICKVKKERFEKFMR